MTFEKLVYVQTKNNNKDSLMNFMDDSDIDYRIKEDDGIEIWVEIIDDVLFNLTSDGWISSDEREEICVNQADTILFF